jgi:hypothetical protein
MLVVHKESGDSIMGPRIKKIINSIKYSYGRPNNLELAKLTLGFVICIVIN